MTPVFKTDAGPVGTGRDRIKLLTTSNKRRLTHGRNRISRG
jgi:hypothetical protein